MENDFGMWLLRSAHYINALCIIAASDTLRAT
jgi:hypothetical protein